jgi:hypothetical protein
LEISPAHIQMALMGTISSRYLARKIFRNANDFRRSSNDLAVALKAQSQQILQAPPSTAGVVDIRKIKHRLPARIPSIVLGAFSAELFLKCLHCLATGKPAWGHDLKELYISLPAANKRHIEAYWNAVAAINPILVSRSRLGNGRKTFRLGGLLKTYGRAFQQWRYHFQYKPRDFCLPNFADVLHNVIVTQKPTWGKRVKFGPAGIDIKL